MALKKTFFPSKNNFYTFILKKKTKTFALIKKRNYFCGQKTTLFINCLI